MQGSRVKGAGVENTFALSSSSAASNSISCATRSESCFRGQDLAAVCGTYKTVTDRLWPWLEPFSGKSPESCRVVPYSLGGECDFELHLLLKPVLFPGFGFSGSLLSEYGTCETVKPRLWQCLSDLSRRLFLLHSEAGGSWSAASATESN